MEDLQFQGHAQFAGQKFLVLNRTNNRSDHPDERMRGTLDNVQELDKRKLASRLAYVVSKQRKAALIKTIEVLDKGFNTKTLNRIKTESAQNYGRHYDEVMKETRERYLKKIDNLIVKEFEQI